jgi:polysaccharide chain length determinant protein (PEP-CTERM system associated)
MLSKGDVTVGEVKRILRRYWWILPTTVVTAGGIGLAATLVLPKKYTSSTMVLVEPPAVAAEVVPTAVNEDLYRHLASMKEQILSRSRLQPIMLKFNLSAKNDDSRHIEDSFEELKKMIEVELIQPMPGSVNKQPPGFHVSVTLPDPQSAQQVCTEITSMFMEQNATTQEKRFKDTTSFLTQQLAEAKANLDQQDDKLAQFKREHLGTLPEEEQSNLSLLTGMNSQLDAATQALSRAQQDKTFNESLLSQQETAWKASQGGMPNTDSLDAQLSILQEQLSALLAKYTPEHPDVLKTKAQIEDVRRRMAASDEDPKKGATTTKASTREPAQIQQLRAKIKQDDLNIADLTKQQAQIQRQIGILQAHVQASPMVEQQIKELTRNYQTALEHYNDLLKNQQKSAMLTDLQDQQEGEQFRVLDAPSLPTSPSFPKKSVFVGGGLAAGLAVGLCILYLLAMSDKAMYTERDVEVCLKLPVLTLVPTFDLAELAPEPKSKSRRSKEITVVPTKA